tara:strand:+ start:221 stop:661 length:441 start_codon:yes stop_codon:yes gene_type:complete
MNKSNKEKRTIREKKERESLQKLSNHIEKYRPKDNKHINRHKILQAYVRLLEVTNGIPTQAELVSYTGLSRATIQQHLEGIKEYLSDGDACLAFKPILLNKIFQTALSGDVKAMRLGAEILRLNEQNNSAQQVMNQQVIYEIVDDE